MKGAMTFKKAEPVQFIYQVKGGSKKAEKDLLKLTGELLKEMEILKEG